MNTNTRFSTQYLLDFIYHQAWMGMHHVFCFVFVHWVWFLDLHFLSETQHQYCNLFFLLSKRHRGFDNKQQTFPSFRTKPWLAWIIPFIVESQLPFVLCVAIRTVPTRWLRSRFSFFIGGLRIFLFFCFFYLVRYVTHTSIFTIWKIFRFQQIHQRIFMLDTVFQTYQIIQLFFVIILLQIS